MNISPLLVTANERGSQSMGQDTSEKKKAIVLNWEELPNILTAGYLIPKPIIAQIFYLLPPDQLFIVRMVCRLWHQIASKQFSLPRLFPKALVLSKMVWEKRIDLQQHGLVFEEGKEPPPLTKREYIEIERMASEVEDEQGVSIITLPKGLSLPKILAFSEAPKSGNTTRINICRSLSDENFLNNIKVKEIDETITVIVTNGVFKGSRNIYVKKKELAKALKCDEAEILPFMAHIILSFINSNPDAPLRLFSETFTSIDEETVGRVLVITGDFRHWGPTIMHHPVQRFDHERVGVAGMRKFSKKQ